MSLRGICVLLWWTPPRGRANGIGEVSMVLLLYGSLTKSSIDDVGKWESSYATDMIVEFWN